MKAGWPITTLGNEIDLLAGFAFKSVRYTNDDEAIRLLRGDNIVQGCLRWDDVKKWPADDIASYDNYQLRDGDVVLAMDRPWVKAGLKHAMISADDLPCLLVQRTARLRPTKNLDNRFLMYLIGSDDFTGHTLGVQTGIGVPHISGQQIKDFQFRLPPLAEQRRIVGILDEAFEGLATAKANAEQNLQNARALFESHLQAVFTQRGDGWVEKSLGDLIEIQNGFAFKSNEYTDSGYFVIRIGNVQDGEITLDNPKYIQLADKKLERFILNEGDILISLTGNIGRVGILQEEQLPAVLNQRVARITVSSRNAVRDFIFRFLSSRTFRDGLQEAGHGAAQQNVSTKEIESVRISIPDSTEQRRIVKCFDAFAEETQRLESLYQRKLAALDELKKSLLHRAFSGQL